MPGQGRLVVVGGGSGFIGSALVKNLERRGYDTLTISRKLGKKSKTWNDLQSEGLPKGTSAVVNVAGQNILDPKRRWTAGFKQNVYASRVHTTRYLAEAIAKAEQKPKTFVSISGVGFYPPSATTVYDETSNGGDFDYLSELCADWEKAAILPNEFGVRNVVIRSGVVLGKEGGMIKELMLPFYLGLGGPVGSGSQSLPWIHLDDLTNLFVHSVECDRLEGIVNGVAPHTISNKEFSKSFAGALGRPALLPLPVFVLNSIFSKDRAKIMTEGQKVSCAKAQQSGFQFDHPTIDEACKHIVR